MGTEANKQVDEATSAASTLKQPGSQATKSELLSAMMRVVGSMKKQDLSAFLDQTLKSVGKEDDVVPSSASNFNKSSISMKSSDTKPDPTASTAMKAMKEDVSELFEGQEGISEEFVQKAGTLFEAAVSNRVAIIEAEMLEEVEARVEREVSEAVDTMHEQVDQYLSYVADKWLEENRVELEANYRVEFTEGFLEGLRNLFVEKYVEVPEGKTDVIERLEQRVSELEEENNEVCNENIKLNRLISEARLEAVFDEVAEGLTSADQDRLARLAESLSYESVEEYEQKLETIRESFLDGKPAKKLTESTGLIEEEATIGSEGSPETKSVSSDPNIQRYVQSISSTVGK